MLGVVKSGYRWVSAGFLLFTTLMAVDAGRVHESGTGAMWIAPELLPRALPARHCAQVAAIPQRDLVFETLDPRHIDDHLPLITSSAPREVVNFEWNAATGELSFDTHSASAVFSDLAAAQVSSGSLPSCGSR